MATICTTRSAIWLVQYAMWWGAAVCVASTAMVWTHTTTAVIKAHVFVCTSQLGIGHEPPAKDHEMAPGHYPVCTTWCTVTLKTPSTRQNRLLLPSWGWINNTPAPSAHPHLDICCTDHKHHMHAMPQRPAHAHRRLMAGLCTPPPQTWSLQQDRQ